MITRFGKLRGVCKLSTWRRELSRAPTVSKPGPSSRPQGPVSELPEKAPCGGNKQTIVQCCVVCSTQDMFVFFKMLMITRRGAS